MTKTKAEAVPSNSVPAAPRRFTKTERLLDMLKTSSGASLEEMSEAMGWLPHTVRAAITGLRRRGFVVTRHVEGNTTVWSVDAGTETAA